MLFLVFMHMLLLVVIGADLLLLCVCSDHAKKDDVAFVEGVVPPQNESAEEGAKLAEAQAEVESVKAHADRVTD